MNQAERVFNVEAGYAIKRARYAHGLTQGALADLSGVSKNHVARVERGERGLSLYVAHQLSDTLGMTIDDMIHYARRPS